MLRFCYALSVIVFIVDKTNGEITGKGWEMKVNGKSVVVNEKTERILWELRQMAVSVRGLRESQAYIYFYKSILDTLEVVQYINLSRRKGKAFNEERLFKVYKLSVGQMKKYAKDYEEFVLSYKTENPEEEPGKMILNSDDKVKLAVVRAVRTELAA